jgi:hypothetical protein
MTIQLTLFDTGEAETTTVQVEFANPFLTGAYWRAYTPDTGESKARALFRERFGCEPAIVRLDRGNLLAGPLPAGV